MEALRELQNSCSRAYSYYAFLMHKGLTNTLVAKSSLAKMLADLKPYTARNPEAIQIAGTLEATILKKTFIDELYIPCLARIILLC